MNPRLIVAGALAVLISMTLIIIYKNLLKEQEEWEAGRDLGTKEWRVKKQTIK